MAIEGLGFGDSVAGLLLDGEEGTPFVGATLRLNDPEGVRVEVPYFSSPNADQFSAVQKWFSDRSPPENMVLYAADGVVSLFNVSWTGHSENWGGVRTSIGTLAPSEAVLGHRDGELSDPLKFARLYSRLDALNEWTRMSSVSEQTEVDDDSKIRAATYSMRSPEAVTWVQGDARMSLQGGWGVSPRADGYRRLTTIDDIVSLESDFESPASFWDHFVEQRKVATLLVFLFGRPIAFREHRLRDDRFVARMMDGRIYNHPRHEVISRHTVRERATPVPTKKDLGRPIAHLGQIGPDGLTAWANAYETWSRFILPSASVLGRRGAFTEDVVVSTSMSIEAAGGLLGPQGGEDRLWNGRGRTPTKVNVYRCLHFLGLPVSEIGDEVGLAIAIADNYNDVKHFDRGDFPDQLKTYLVSRVNKLVVRLIAMTLTGHGNELLREYREGGGMWRLHQEFSLNRMRVNADGTWEELPSDD